MQRLPIAVLVAVCATVLVAGRVEATWSIVGADPDTGEVGVAVASCVGFEVTSVPVLVPGVGAAASQADISTGSGERFADALESGASAQAVIDAVVAADDRPDDRQFGVVVVGGGAAGWTGADNLAVAADRRTADGAGAAQGNIVVSEAVIDATLAAFDATDGELADRLLAGLLAGADAGGDSRCGEQTATAAALLVATPGDAVYAHTDASALGVDPGSTPIPSVFVSVLVNRDGDRAPDRLAEALGLGRPRCAVDRDPPGRRRRRRRCKPPQGAGRSGAGPARGARVRSRGALVATSGQIGARLRPFGSVSSVAVMVETTRSGLGCRS